MQLLSYFVEHNRYLNIAGILFILFVAWLFSKKRSAINYRLVCNALVVQGLIAFGVLRFSGDIVFLILFHRGLKKSMNLPIKDLSFYLEI